MCCDSWGRKKSDMTEPLLRVRTLLSDVAVQACVLGHVRRFATVWTAAHQTLLSMGFPRQKHWMGLPFPPLVYLPDPGIKPESIAFSALASGFFFFYSRATWTAQTLKRLPQKR